MSLSCIDENYQVKPKSFEVETRTPVDHNFHPEIMSPHFQKWLQSRPEEYHSYRKSWNDFAVNKRLSLYPIHLDIEASSSCNLKCTMCPRTDLVNDGKFWESKLLTFEKFKSLIDQCRYHLHSIKFNILGEPLLNRDLPRMIRYAKSKEYPICDIMLNTNGVVLDGKRAEELIDSGLDQIFFSFDSPYPEKYESIRVGAKFENVLKNIRLFRQIRDAKKSTSPLMRASMIRFPDTPSQEWDDFVSLMSPLVDVVAWVEYIDHSDGEKPRSEEKRLPFCCPQLWQRMFIHPDGVVTPCCVNSSRSLAVGNINETQINNVWHSDAYNRLRQLHKNGRYDEIPECANCHLARL